jgi:hypothetical protein
MLMLFVSFVPWSRLLRVTVMFSPTLSQDLWDFVHELVDCGWCEWVLSKFAVSPSRGRKLWIETRQMDQQADLFLFPDAVGAEEWIYRSQGKW